MKKFIAVIAIAAVGYGAYTQFFGGRPNGGFPMGAMPVSIAKPLQKNVILWKQFSGRVRAVEDAKICPRVSGVIEQVHFKEGDLVRKGDVLFSIDMKPYTTQYNQAEAIFQAAQSRATLAKLNLERAKELLATKTIAQKDFDLRNSAALEAEGNLKSALAAKELAELNLDYAAVKAPIDGKIGRAEITVGNMVASAFSAPVLTTIQSVNPVYVDFEIDEQTYLKLQADMKTSNGANAQVSMSLSNEADGVRKGTIQSLDNQVNSASGTLRVRAVFENPDGALTPGLFARVFMGSAVEQKVTLIQDQAIGTDQDRKFVLAATPENTVAYKPVKLGAIVDGLRAVEGLTPEDAIVVNGLMRVRPGSPIIPQMVGMDTLQPLSPPPADPTKKQ